MDVEYHQQGHTTMKKGKQHNTLPLWGNETSMNLNPLILANIQSSSYFKVHLFKLKTYHEVVDEIYYQVKHLEPWERGSRKTSGQTGMCGGVRGVGAGGIVSTAFCLLYKLYTLRLTRKQVNGLLNHTDSPYIRALGFMYLRYTQPPSDLYEWYEDYLQDEEEIDVKAGGGQVITIGNMVYQFLTKLDWFSTLFPRIPVSIQKIIEKNIELYCRENKLSLHQLSSSHGLNQPATASSGRNYDIVEDGCDRRGSSGRNREYLSGNRSAGIISNYRSDHDDRNYQSPSSATYNRRREDPSQSASYERRNTGERERQRERQKKHKYKYHSSSRSRSRSRCRQDRERYQDRDRSFEKFSYNKESAQSEDRERRYR